MAMRGNAPRPLAQKRVSCSASLYLRFPLSDRVSPLNSPGVLSDADACHFTSSIQRHRNRAADQDDPGLFPVQRIETMWQARVEMCRVACFQNMLLARDGELQTTG